LSGGEFLQALEVPVKVEVKAGTRLQIGDVTVPAREFIPASFSQHSAKVSAQTVFVGYGLTLKEQGLDDYKAKNVKGKIAVIRRFHPGGARRGEGGRGGGVSARNNKPFAARGRGAGGVLFVDRSEPGKADRGEAELPPLALARLQDVGIPAFIVK